ncbi:NACHT, LRR and PYD domains-containing protein 3-like [Alosa pseudoharengus]|uniref:NACHT, LRR and PYD domains-containing protein 3-like n=1 Tax=Alosa pseudoharengus TaxID=34774 RepID=UPI003F8B7CF6
MGDTSSNSRPPSPTPTHVSMKSDKSMDPPITFRGQDSSTGQMRGASSNRRPPSPTPTHVSMKSDKSMDPPITFTGGDFSIEHRPPSPTPTHVSMKSDKSMDPPITFRGQDSSTGQMRGASSNRRPPSPTPTHVSMKSDKSMDPPITFTGQDSSTGQPQTLGPVSPVPSCLSMKSDASLRGLLKCSSGPPQSDPNINHSANVSFGLDIYMATQKVVKWKMTCNPKSVFNCVLAFTHRYQQIHKSHLQKKFQCLIEGITQQGDTKLLHEIYTELYIVERERGEVNDEHEVRQIERTSWRKAAQDTPIKCSDVFKPLSGQDKPIRTVLTKGVAGIGKTVSVQKFILDWAEGTANQDIHFIFPLSFRELNLMKEKKLSLMDLIQHFFPEIKDPRIFTSSAHRVMFIFDGLDECRLPLDFHSNPMCCDVTEPASVDVLLTNLIKVNLPSALLWITTRPAAANQIPFECVGQVTEIRGFNDPQKEEYFRKRMSDENLASRTITHLRSFRSLYIMCHIPVFCWISATVVEMTSKESDKVEMPRTLTQMYTRFLIIQTHIKHVKYSERKETDEEVIFKLGKLAFQQLDEGNLIFYEDDLRECGIDVTEASVYSGVCTQIFREEPGKVFSFVHLSIQEFLAALYVFLCFSNRERNMPDQQQTSQLSALFRATTLHDLHKTAVDLALQSKNGHLDLFLRFLLGLSLESNQILLNDLLPQSNSQSDSTGQTVQYVKQKIRDQSSSDRRINLFYCLNELNHHAVVEVIDRSSGTLSVDTLLPGEWKTMIFKFEMSEDQLAEFDLQRYIKTPEKDQTELLSPEEVFQRLVPVTTTSTSAELNNCSLTEKSISYLASALTAHSSSLRRLNLSGNKLLDSGMELLCSALSHQKCKLEKLQLKVCSLTKKSCSYLASSLTAHSSSLRLLDLTSNELLDSGLELLCYALCHQNCKLEELELRSCNLTEKSCSYLASALTAHSSSLRLLDLTGNELLDSGVELLCSALCHQNCKLEEFKLEYCNLTDKGCSYLASALTAHSSSLRLLNLSENNLLDSGVELLCSAQNCKLETLMLRGCGLTEKSCSYLASSLTSRFSSLSLLDLSQNDGLTKPAVEQLSVLVNDPHCKLEKLDDVTIEPSVSHAVWLTGRQLSWTLINDHLLYFILQN